MPSNADIIKTNIQELFSGCDDGCGLPSAGASPAGAAAPSSAAGVTARINANKKGY